MSVFKDIKRTVLAVGIILLILIGGDMLFQPMEQEKPPESMPQDESVENSLESSQQPAELQVHFLDVGQGDATLILCDGHAMLIDAGGNNKGTAVQLYLKKQGVQSLDYIVGTHPDSDHIGGMDVILTKFDCGTILMPGYEKDTATYRDVLEAIDYKSYQITEPVVGNTYFLGEAGFTIIAPHRTDYEEANNVSIGIKLVHGENCFLFTADAEGVAQMDMINSGLDIQADVLKIGHHGSWAAMSPAWIEAVRPEYGIISCGIGNDYGHPHEQTLALLAEKNVQLFRTDVQGSIVAISDGAEIAWNCKPTENWSPGVLIQEAIMETEGVLSSEKVKYILNTNSMKFHRTDCESAAKIREHNREKTDATREELMMLGYSACGFCKP